MSPSDANLRIPVDFLREARRLFGRFRLPSGMAGPSGPAFPVELCGGFDGITLAAGDGRCRLESFRRATLDAAGHGCVLLSRQALAEACRADPGTRVELAACHEGGGGAGQPQLKFQLRLRLRCGGVWLESFHPPAGRPPLAAPDLPDGGMLRLPARTMEALAMVAPFADWNAAAGPWRRGVCFTPTAGGRLIAGDRQRLAVVPARVPPQAFVLPLAAVRVLLHADFLGYENEVTLPRPGAEPRIMFRAWDQLLVSPVLPVGRLENDARLREPQEGAALAGRRVLPDAVSREHLLGWLRALRDAHAAVTLKWLAGGVLSVNQGGVGGGDALLELPAAFLDQGPASRPPRLVLASRDLAAALNLGGMLGIGVSHTGRALLHCRGAGGVFCQVASLVRAPAGGRALRGSGRRHAA